MTEKKEELIQIGEIYREHGIKGEVKVWVYSRSDENFRKGMPVILRRTDGEEMEAKILEVTPFQQWFLTRFSFLKNPEEARLWRKAKILVGRKDLASAGMGEYYLFDLIGYAVVDIGGCVIGTLEGMMGEGETALFVVCGQDEKEILIPAVPAWIEKVDRKGKKIVVKLQEGL
ncbi:MAG: 16S rRNA processing protein RimM [Deltaproteobacteria bacterium]|nr:16S rRNA processing protein RimM [Deltaproteobacteria bacterium]